MNVRRALLWVNESTEVVDLARALHELGWEILASPCTLQKLAGANPPVPATDAMVMVHAAILGRSVVVDSSGVHTAMLARNSRAEDADMNDFPRIDLVCVNPPSKDNDGPTLIAWAAGLGNYVLTRPNLYDPFIEWVRNGEAKDDDLIKDMAGLAVCLAGDCAPDDCPEVWVRKGLQYFATVEQSATA